MTDNTYDNEGRRRFFRSFAGKTFEFLQEISGHRNIPLSRLDTLPAETVEGIIPVLFKDGGWGFKDNLLLKYSDEEQKYQSFRKFDEEELFVIEHFNKKKTLKSIASLYSEKYKQDFQACFKKVSSLFFELAKLRVYHPLKVYDSII
jgi:hypothetical protein